MHAATALNLLVSCLKTYDVKIILSKKVGKVDNLSEELKQLKKCEQDGAEWIFARLAKELKAEIFSYENVNAESALSDFHAFAPDLVVSIRFGQIFKSPLISIPRFGVINLHSGILPNYRGVMATFWAILNGDKKIGTTLHFISDAKIDEGEIIGFSEVEVDRNRSLIFNINNVYEGGCTLLSEAIGKIACGEKISTIKQSNLGEGKYFSYPQEGDVRKFLNMMPLTTEEDVGEIFMRVFKINKLKIMLKGTALALAIVGVTLLVALWISYLRS